MGRRAAILGLVALAFLGCGPARQSVADYEVLVAVKRYDQTLPAAYTKGTAALLDGAASAAEIQRVDDVISFLAQGGMVMDARQETFQAARIAHLADNRAELDATEVWWYRHWVPTTGEVRQAPRRVRYQNRFHCTKVGGRWVVDRLEELGFERLPENRAAI